MVWQSRRLFAPSGAFTSMNPGFSGLEGAAGGTLKLDSSGAAPILLAVLAVVIFAMKQPVSRPNGPIAARRG